MWVKVSYNRILYQNGNWKDGHFAELDNGMLLCYEVNTRHASGKLARVLSHSADHLGIKLAFENESGEQRSVVVLCGSIRQRNLVLHTLNTTAAAGDDSSVVFETVLIKYPTEGGGGGGIGAAGDRGSFVSRTSNLSLSSPPPAPLQRRDSQRMRADSLVSAKLDELTAYMGTSQRRLFRFYANGSVAYYEAAPVACVSVSSPSSLVCLLQSPAEYVVVVQDGDGEQGDSDGSTKRSQVYPATVSSAQWEATVPQPPASTTTHPLRMLSRKLFATAPAEDKKQRSPFPASLTFYAPTPVQREQWLEQIQSYSAWFHKEFAKDSLDRKRARVVLKGWCWKRGQFNVLNYHWKLRFLLVLSNKEVVYYDSELGGTVLGAIPLSKLRSVKLAQSQDKPQGFADVIELDTQGRTWYLSPQAVNRGQQAVLLEKWITAIRELAASSTTEDTPPPPQQESSPRSSSLMMTGHYAPDAFFAAPAAVLLDLPCCVPIVRLSGWERLSGNTPSALLSSSQWKDDILLRGSAAGTGADGGGEEESAAA